MFTYVVIVFVFLSDLIIFSNVEAFISFLIFLAVLCVILILFNKFYYIIFWSFVIQYKPILIIIFKLLAKFEYFDQIYKLIKFLVKLKKISLFFFLKGDLILFMFFNFLISPYFIVCSFFIISGILGLIVYFISYFLVIKNYNNEKLSVYECGFDPFVKSDSLFDVRYYLVAILFIIFDLEISFLFPWSVVFKQLGLFGFYSVFIFLSILASGFIYEWLCGALDW